MVGNSTSMQFGKTRFVGCDRPCQCPGLRHLQLRSRTSSANLPQVVPPINSEAMVQVLNMPSFQNLKSWYNCFEIPTFLPCCLALVRQLYRQSRLDKLETGAITGKVRINPRAGSGRNGCIPYHTGRPTTPSLPPFWNGPGGKAMCNNIWEQASTMCCSSALSRLFSRMSWMCGRYPFRAAQISGKKIRNDEACGISETHKPGVQGERTFRYARIIPCTAPVVGIPVGHG